MFGPDYSKPGKGVEKRDPNQPRIKLFFELLWRKLWNLCKVNLLYLITSIPTFLVTFLVMCTFSADVVNEIMPAIERTSEVLNADFTAGTMIVYAFLAIAFAFVFQLFLGQGATTAGITYILRNYANEENVWMLSDWWEYTKSNFRQGLIVWVVDLIVISVLAFAFRFYFGLSGIASFVAYIIVFFAVIYIMMHFYIYQLMITFKNSVKNIFKNAFLLAMEKCGKNLLILLGLLIVHIGVPYMMIKFGWHISLWIAFIIAEILILPAISGFVINFSIYPQIQKHKK